MSDTATFTARTWSSNGSTSAEQEQPLPSPSRVPRRRRPWLIAVAVGLVAVAITGNYLLISSLTERRSMLVLTHDVGWGQRITAADLDTTELLPESVRFAIPAAHRSRVVGRIAAHNLAAGELLSAGDVTRQVVPAAGQRVVGLRLQPGQYPARGLRANDPVQVVPLVPGSTGQASKPAGEGFRARVVQSSPPAADGAITVDVLVDAELADRAAAAAAGEVLVMLLGPQR